MIIMPINQWFFYLGLIIAPFISAPYENSYDEMRIMLHNKRTEVKMVIKDEARADIAQYQLYLMSEEILRFNKQYKKESEEIARLYMQYESTPDDFQLVLGRIDLSRANGQEKIMEEYFTLKKNMTKEEWTLVFEPKDKGENTEHP